MRRIAPLVIVTLAACTEGILRPPPLPQTVTDVAGLYTLSVVNDDSLAGNRIFIGVRPCKGLPLADDSLFIGPEGYVQLLNDRTLEWNLVRQTFCSATSVGGVDSRIFDGTYTTTDLRGIVVTVRFALSDTAIGVGAATAIRGEDARTGSDGTIIMSASTVAFSVLDSLGDYRLTFAR